ncbi:uncharacterized protein LOC125369311 [Ricinus communis]|uniref:uncharacterized protein LOC125369311 n=1 Tax=Ricinus communis TaxID=3988 RepID=UPI00201AC561|nr:uncharacterized protein LOC125369311 [Ricinus communis]
MSSSRKEWALKLDDALWAYRKTFKTPIGLTPYQLIYAKSCHLPIELEHKAYWATRTLNFDVKKASRKRLELFLGKLRSRWSGPFKVIKVYPHDAVDLANAKGEFFKAFNGASTKLIPPWVHQIRDLGFGLKVEEEFWSKSRSNSRDQLQCRSRL